MAVAKADDAKLADAKPTIETNDPEEKTRLILEEGGPRKVPQPKYVDIDLADLDLPPPVAKHPAKSATSLPASLRGLNLSTTKKQRELKNRAQSFAAIAGIN